MSPLGIICCVFKIKVIYIKNLLKQQLVNSFIDFQLVSCSVVMKILGTSLILYYNFFFFFFDFFSWKKGKKMEWGETKYYVIQNESESRVQYVFKLGFSIFSLNIDCHWLQEMSEMPRKFYSNYNFFCH